jgi:hypothetical protein
MSNGNTALALTLGAGGGLALWYVLRDRKRKQLASAPTPAPQIVAPASAAPDRACSLRLDPAGLTVDGAKMNVADAVKRCQTAGRADVTIVKDAPAATYADLMVALGRAGIPIYAHRNSRGARGPRGRRRAARNTVDAIDLPMFAETVLALADEIDDEPSPWGLARGRINDREVLIASIRRALADTEYGELSRAAVDELLLRARREGLLELACVEADDTLDADELRESEIVGPRYHAVVVAPERSRNMSPPVSTFTLAVYPRGYDGPKRVTWYTSETPVPWEVARDRLIDAGVIDRSLFRRTREPGGWVMASDPRLFQSDRAKPLPDGDDE